MRNKFGIPCNKMNYLNIVFTSTFQYNQQLKLYNAQSQFNGTYISFLFQNFTMVAKGNYGDQK